MSNPIESLIKPTEPGPFEMVRPDGKCPIVLVCDHASQRIPARLGDLGLTEEQLHSHIAWDIGAAALARALSARLDATLLLSNYSRLVIDCNRPPAHAESIPASSAGIAIPGNQAVAQLEVLRRRRNLFEPYQQAIAETLDARNNRATRLLSLHSFTPTLNGAERPWLIGVCYNRERRWARKLLSAVGSACNGPVGDNQPYAVEPGVDYTIPYQGERRAIPSVMLELRQDQLKNELAVQRWCNIIVAALN